MSIEDEEELLGEASAAAAAALRCSTRAFFVEVGEGLPKPSMASISALLPWDLEQKAIKAIKSD